MSTLNGPCPVCGDHDGFHHPEQIDGAHAAAARRIPTDLVRSSNSAIRRERRAAVTRA